MEMASRSSHRRMQLVWTSCASYLVVEALGPAVHDYEGACCLRHRRLVGSEDATTSTDPAVHLTNALGGLLLSGEDALRELLELRAARSSPVRR